MWENSACAQACLQRCAVQGANGPVHAVFGENWVVYTYWSSAAHRCAEALRYALISDAIGRTCLDASATTSQASHTWLQTAEKYALRCAIIVLYWQSGAPYTCA